MRKGTGLKGKKELDAQLNLTPFIDLLSTCVCFLLVTAVWIEIGSVEIKQSHGTAAPETKKETYDLDVVYQNPTALRLNLKKDGKQVKSIDVKENTAESMLSKLSEVIPTQILKLKNNMIEIATATVTPRSSVDYGNLVHTLDVLRKNKILNIGVLTARERQ